MNRRSFFQRLCQAACVAVAAPYMALAPLRPRMVRVKELNAILKAYYLEATRDLLNSKRILSTLCRQKGSFEIRGQPVHFELNLHPGHRKHDWVREYTADALCCVDCHRRLTGPTMLDAHKAAGIRNSECFPGDRDHYDELERARWAGMAHYAALDPVDDHEEHLRARAEFIVRHDLELDEMRPGHIERLK